MTMTRRSMLLGATATLTCGPACANPATPAPLAADDILCHYAAVPSFRGTTVIRPPKEAAQNAVQAIVDLIGMRSVFNLYEADFSHGGIAFAAVRDRSRYVVYDAKWFPIDKVGLAWYMVSIFGHEIGHHIYSHTKRVGENHHRNELDADRFGGWVVARLGGTEKDAIAFTPRLREEETRTHPARDDRVEAYLEGWKAGRKLFRRL